MILELDSLLNSTCFITHYSEREDINIRSWALIVWAKLLGMHLFEIISLIFPPPPASQPTFPICVQFVFPAGLIWFWFVGWWLSLCRLMADNYCDLAVDNAVHHHQQECSGSTLHLVPPGPPRSFIIRNLGRWLTRPWPNWGLSVTMTIQHHQAFLSSSLPILQPGPGIKTGCVCRLCDTVTACLMSVQMLSEEQDLAPYTALCWGIFGLG